MGINSGFKGLIYMVKAWKIKKTSSTFVHC